MMKLLILLLLSGCAPYVEYMHLDATPLNNDGMAYDLVCGGTVYGDSLTFDIAACKDIRAGTAFRATVRYTIK